MSEMVERVARALAIADGIHPEAVSNDENQIPIWTLYKDDARAVIEAMLEPTMAMIEAGQMENNLLENPDPPNAFLFLSRAEMKGAWQAMIQAALSPSGEK